jgi:hypothetical protein
MSSWDSDIMDDLDDDLEDTEDDLDDDMSLDDGGDEVSGDDDQLSDDEIAADYAVSDVGVQALSADRGAAMHQASILGDGGSKSLEKKLSGDSAIVRIVVHFANGRKLYLTP